MTTTPFSRHTHVSLSLTAAQHQQLHAHLFPGDGKEAVAIALCGRRAGTHNHRLVVREIYPIPYDKCIAREPDRVHWTTDVIVPWLDRADKNGWSVVKVHGHATWPHFSMADDRSDSTLLPSVADWVSVTVPHASVVMLEDGRLFGRWHCADISVSGSHNGSTELMFSSLSHISVVGSDFDFYLSTDFYDANETTSPTSEFARRFIQVFGTRTFERLQHLSVAVVGCSGTGTFVIEQLLRLGVGRLVLIDPDIVKQHNLDRMLNTRMHHVRNNARKVDVAAEAIRETELGTQVIALPANLYTRSAVEAVAECDAVFGCVDTAEGRYLLNRLSTFYTLPYIDLGVRVDGDPKTGEIINVTGAVHYLQPGLSSLLSRGVITMERVKAEGLLRSNPQDYEVQRQQGYIHGIDDDRPAVISLNTLTAGMAVNDFLSRLHDYRTDGNARYAEWRVSLSHMEFFTKPEGEPCSTLVKHVGRGDVEPLLEMPVLS